jgi:hypothetical protein
MLTTTTTTKAVNIRPEVSVLSVFPHLNYKPWYAIAEFVDNSIQSFLTHQEALVAVERKKTKLQVDIELSTLDNGQITIRDNAAGIHEHDYQRAFKTAAVPMDRSGLSEFGVGMKSAACWFARHWSVRTSALGEDVERGISFDVNTIVRDGIENIIPDELPAAFSSHFTEVTLRNLHNIPQGRTVGKIKEHLASIYRIFIHEGILDLRFNGDLLTYTQPKILRASHYKQEDGSAVLWLKEIDLNFGAGQHVYGFAALRETASTSGAGFALFRRKRLIQGSGDEGYRPEQVFKKANSFTYQRLFGELHIEGFDVSHTKDGIQWAEYEDIFLEFLKDRLNEQPLPLLDQAEGYRVRPKPIDLKRGADEALDATVKVIERDVPPVVGQQLQEKPMESPLPPVLPPATITSERTIDLNFNDTQWRIIVELSSDPAIGDWLTVSDQVTSDQDMKGNITRKFGIRLSLAHPFMDRFSGPDSEQIEPLLRVAVALALAEITAREGGVKKAGSIRIYLNELLRNALSKA